MLTGNVGKPEQVELTLMQSVTQKLSVGGLAHISMQRHPVTGQNFPWNYLMLGTRFNADKWVGQMTCKEFSQFNFSYTHRLKELGHLSVEMDHLLQPQRDRAEIADFQKVTFGLELKSTLTHNKFRAFVNSNGVVGSMLEVNVSPIARLTYGLQMDHTKSEFKCVLHMFFSLCFSFALRHGLGLDIQL